MLTTSGVVGQFHDVKACFNRFTKERNRTDLEFRQRKNEDLLAERITTWYTRETNRIKKVEDMAQDRGPALDAVRLALLRGRVDIEIERAKRGAAERQPNWEQCLEHLVKAERKWEEASSFAASIMDSRTRAVMLDYDLAVIRAVKAEVLEKHMGWLPRWLSNGHDGTDAATAFTRIEHALDSVDGYDANTVRYYEVCRKLEQARLLNPTQRPELSQSRPRLLLDPELSRLL